jgi:ABC-type branched-subunit amino acid transport system ATPase component
MLNLNNIKGGYVSGSLVLQDISLEVKSSEVVGIIGLNGCGKSTLGKAIMNLLPFRQGSIELNGKDITLINPGQMAQAGISMMMQGGRIFRHMTVMEHCMMAAHTLNEKTIKKKLEILGVLYKTDIFTANNNWFGQKGSYLSGGEKQKLALIMALINQPTLLILDEVSAGLSPDTLEMVTIALEHIKAGKKTGIILIEQNIRLAARLSDRLLLLERGVIDQEFRVDASFDIEKLIENIFN